MCITFTSLKSFKTGSWGTGSVGKAFAMRIDDLSLILRTQVKKPGVEVHAYNPALLERAGGREESAELVFLKTYFVVCTCVCTSTVTVCHSGHMEVRSHSVLCSPDCRLMT